MKYIFGKDFTYSLYFYEDNLRLAEAEIPAQTITAYLYKDQPSRDQARTGTGSLQTISKLHTGGQPVELPVEAILDPNPDSAIDLYQYWLAVNLKLETDSIEDEIIIRSIYLERVSAQDKEIGVTASSILEIWPDLYSYLSETQVSSLIALAKAEILDDITTKGYDWNKIFNPEQLFYALLFNSLVHIYNSQINTVGDRFSVLSERMEKRYVNIKANLKLSYDATGSGQVSTVESPMMIRAVR